MPVNHCENLWISKVASTRVHQPFRRILVRALTIEESEDFAHRFALSEFNISSLIHWFAQTGKPLSKQ